MLEVVIRFFTFEVITVHPVAYFGLGAVWLLLMVASTFSILSIPVSRAQKALWFFLVFFVPVLGLAAYALRCLICGDWSFLKPLLVSPPPKMRKL